MPARDIVVIGASAGGLAALLKLVSQLPTSYTGTLLVVVHIPAARPSHLPDILSRHSLLPATHARDGETLRPGHIYVAPPDQHLLLQDSLIRLAQSAKENRARPAIDPLFRAAADTYGERVVGIVLSGALSDGTAGLVTIKHSGGVTIVQDPAEADFASMPQNAISRDHPDYILPISEIAVVLVRLAQETGEQTEARARSKLYPRE